MGKIVHTQLLLPEGRFHMDHLNSLLAVGGKRSDMVGLTSQFKRQLYFWLTMLIACSECCTVPPRPSKLSSWAVQYLQMLQQWAGACCAGKGIGAYGSYHTWVVMVGLDAMVPGFKQWETHTWWNEVQLETVIARADGPLLAICCAAVRLYSWPWKFWEDNAGASGSTGTVQLANLPSKYYFERKLYNCNSILLSWLALKTSAIGNLNQSSELNVVSHLENLYIHIYDAHMNRVSLCFTPEHGGGKGEVVVFTALAVD